MEVIFRWTDDPDGCEYLHDRIRRRECLYVAEIDADEAMKYLVAGWRRFGRTIYRPRCPGCNACRSLRVDAARFRPDRSQRRCRKANEGTVRLRIGTPKVTPEKVALLDLFHADRSETKGWSSHDPDDPSGYVLSFVDNPVPTQEWCYFLDDVLVGVGYVDQLAGGLSAIYFAHDPNQSARSLGTWNVLCLLDRARALGLPHVYLGYHVEGCGSLEYKARFLPNEILEADGLWHASIAPS
jgi:arginyl-tRNA--protein-N-Asp/Glu arginylyltransferase